ncbi:MAG TPA: DUF6371 domain-containing protein [Salinimicrobium sp.]|nr:DUF6371 domain-containing protein [Salinimicrobium sp.]
MNRYQYILASNKVPKLDCPYCGAKKHWQRYINIETGEVLPEQYGKCDNADKCGKWSDPYKLGYAKAMREQENGISGSTQITVPKQKYFPARSKLKPQPKPVYFDFETFKRTLGNYDKNVFIQNLLSHVPFPLEPSDVEKVISLYRLGTVSHGYRTGAASFPFIDKKGNVRTIQVKQFNQANHTTGTDFLHSIIEKHHTRKNKPSPKWLETYLKQEKRVSCLFGAHLLDKYLLNPVALVEAPKTAIYGTLYFGFPNENVNTQIWTAVYNLSSLNFDKCKALKGRDVFLYPDLSKDGKAFELWSDKAKELEKHLPGTKFIISDLLEKLAPNNDKTKGYDLADYLIKLDWRLFKKENPKNAAIKPTTTATVENTVTAAIKPLKNKSVDNKKNVKKLISKIHWRHLLTIPLEIREAIIIARNNGKDRQELQKIFSQLKPEEINLILDPNNGGYYPTNTL